MVTECQSEKYEIVKPDTAGVTRVQLYHGDTELEDVEIDDCDDLYEKISFGFLNTEDMPADFVEAWPAQARLTTKA